MLCKCSQLDVDIPFDIWSSSNRFTISLSGINVDVNIIRVTLTRNTLYAHLIERDIDICQHRKNRLWCITTCMCAHLYLRLGLSVYLYLYLSLSISPPNIFHFLICYFSLSIFLSIYLYLSISISLSIYISTFLHSHVYIPLHRPPPLPLSLPVSYSISISVYITSSLFVYMLNILQAVPISSVSSVAEWDAKS